VPDAQGPATAEQQVRFEVEWDRAMRAVTRALGGEYHPGTAGGGGKDGKWVFTCVEQLDAMIKRWTDVRDAIYQRRDKIESAQLSVKPPAADLMSRVQANAFKDSLQQMWQHADSMHKYADAYVVKLLKTRSDYVNIETANTGRMKDKD
jgi:hypothetical protein